MDYYLKTDRGQDAEPFDATDAGRMLRRLRYQGRKLVEIYVLADDGKIDRFQERVRRRLGSNAIASRTWLCETAGQTDWVDGRYVPDPQEAIGEMSPPPRAVLLVLQGAEAPEEIVQQLDAMVVAG